MATAKTIVRKALSQKGNRGTKYWNAYGVPKGTAWCVIFVWWCFKECNASKLFFNGKKTAYVPAVDEWGKKDKLIVNKNNGKKGDIIIFDWGNDGTRDHVGLVVDKNKDGTYKTIEGNTSGGKVDTRLRYKADILHLIRPKYEEEKPVIKKYNLKRKLKYGCYGEDVKKLQKALNKELGCKLVIDGNFGKKTLAKVKEYQKLKKLAVDGIVGKKTAHALGWLWKGK